jgi:hypothetical protein
MAPTWENVGKHFAADDNIVVAKIDAAVNDNPAVVVAVRAFSFSLSSPRSPAPVSPHQRARA